MIDFVRKGKNTKDATATADDIINPRTAYVNNEKITGAIIPSYEAGVPTLSAKNIDFNQVTLDDINIDYNIGVSNTSSVLTIYRIENDTVISKKVINSTDITNISSFYANTAKIAYLADNNTIKIYVAANDVNSHYGAVCVIYNLETDDTSFYDYEFFETPYNSTKIVILPIPNTTDKAIIVRGGRNGSFNYIIHVTIYSFGSQFSYNTIYSANPRNSGGLTGSCSDINYQFITSDNLICINAYYNSQHLWINYIGKLSNDYLSATKIYSNTQWSTVRRVCLLNDLYFYMLNAEQSDVYSISDTSNPIASFDIDDFELSNNVYNVITIGNYLYFVNNNSTTCKVYKIDNTALSLTYDSQMTIGTNNKFFKYNSQFIYNNTSINKLSILEESEQGALYALERLGQTFRLLNKATANVSDILSGKSAYINSGLVSGTMSNNGDVIITPSTEQQSKNSGYYNSLSVEAVTSAIDSNIQAGNIKNGVTILGVTGTLEVLDTSDADATSDDISINKTAYVDGVKVTGALPLFPNTSTFTVDNAGVTNNTEDSTLELTTINTLKQTLDSNLNMKFSTPYADITTAIGLTADKIAEGNTILGVEGTATTGTTPDITIQNGDYGLENATSGELDNDIGIKLFTNANTQSKLYEVGSIVEMHITNELLAQILGITADKIKSGEVICGIEGTYTGNSSIVEEE